MVIRFGSDADDTCMRMDEVRARRNSRDSTDSARRFRRLTTTISPVRATQTLAGVADKIKNFAIIYLVDISEVSVDARRRRRRRRRRLAPPRSDD